MAGTRQVVVSAAPGLAKVAGLLRDNPASNVQQGVIFLNKPYETMEEAMKHMRVVSDGAR